jgi:hypothetical protein
MNHLIVAGRRARLAHECEVSDAALGLFSVVLALLATGVLVFGVPETPATDPMQAGAPVTTIADAAQPAADLAVATATAAAAAAAMPAGRGDEP